jgi:TIR domain/Effector-associated domain 11
MESIVQQLIAAGRIEDALQTLMNHNVDGAIQLMSQYSALKRSNTLGTISFSDYTRESNRITANAIELMRLNSKSAAIRASGGAAAGSTQPTNNVPGTPSSTLKAFISYNHGDSEVVDRIQAYLAARSVEVTRDRDNMEAGERISDFIEDSIRESKFVISVVSERSLQSGWVGKESVAASFAIWLTNQCFIPVRLDNSVFDDAFMLTALRTINDKIKSKEAVAKELKELGGDDSVQQSEIKRLYDLKTNLANIIGRLRDTLVIDLSGDSAAFEAGMDKVLKRIQR